jgi:hypothetical protein
MILILFQLLLLCLTTWGWGFWLCKLSHAGRLRGWNSFGWFFFGLGGYVAQILFLQALIYCNLRLQWTAWVGLAIALAGVLVSVLTRQKAESLASRQRRREMQVAGALFALVFCWQGAPLFHSKPSNYYGNAHTDQVNYVLLAQFLIEKPFSTSLDEVGLQPWLVKPIRAKEFRLGQSVANGFLGVVSLTDAKRSYGTLSIFVICVGAVAVFVLARVLSIPRLLAAAVGFWWGVLPAVTKLQLDGFFSQGSILFVFPAMAALFYANRGRLERTTCLLLTLYLAYLLSTYTEVYVLGVGLVVSLSVLAPSQRIPWKGRATALAAIVAGSLLLCGGYLRFLFSYIAVQYKVAAAAASLASLVPMSGTWRGWKQIFFGYEAITNAGLERGAILASFVIIFLVCCAFQGRTAWNRRCLLALVAPLLGVLALLLSMPELPQYPFSKLLDTFTTFWLVLAVVGLWNVGTLFVPRRPWVRAAAWMLVTGFVLAALTGSWPQWRAVRENGDNLVAVNSPEAQRCYAEARTHPEETFLIAEPNNILCAWTALAARHSKVYVEDDHVSDEPVPASIFAFRRLPPFSGALVLLGTNGPKRLVDAQGQPDLVVRNPQGVDGGGSNAWYWIGRAAQLEVTEFTPSPESVHRYALEFDALAGPANPSPLRGLVLVSPDGSEQKFDFSTRATCHFTVDLHSGQNVFTLKVAYPTEQTFRVATDPRDFMVRTQHFTLTKMLAQSASSSRPALATH